MNVKLKQMRIAMLLAGSVCSNVLSMNVVRNILKRAKPAAALALIGVYADHKNNPKESTKKDRWVKIRLQLNHPPEATHPYALSCNARFGNEMFVTEKGTDASGKAYFLTLPIRLFAQWYPENFALLENHPHIRNVSDYYTNGVHGEAWSSRPSTRSSDAAYDSKRALLNVELEINVSKCTLNKVGSSVLIESRQNSGSVVTYEFKNISNVLWRDGKGEKVFLTSLG